MLIKDLDIIKACDIVRVAPGSLEALKNIKGFGKRKISKYGKEIIEIVKAFYEKS